LKDSSWVDEVVYWIMIGELQMIKGKMKFADYQQIFVDTIQELCILSFTQGDRGPGA